MRLAEFQVGITCGQNSVLTHFSTPRFALRFVDFWSPSFHLLIFLSRRPTETPNYFWNSRPPSCRYPVKAMRTTLRPYTRPPSNYEWPGAYDPHSGPMCRVVWGEGVGRSGAGEYRVGRFSMPGNNLIRCVFRLKKGTSPASFLTWRTETCVRGGRSVESIFSLITPCWTWCLRPGHPPPAAVSHSPGVD